MSNSAPSLNVVTAMVYSGSHCRPAADGTSGLRVPVLMEEEALPPAENLSELREVLARLLQKK